MSTDQGVAAALRNPARWAVTAMLARRTQSLRPTLEAVMTTLSGTETVLDLGAGRGALSLSLAQRLERGHVLAVDRDERRLQSLAQTAKARGLEKRIRCIEADAAATGVPDGSVDRVVACMLLHELPDPAAVAREMARVTRPGGRLFVRDFRKTALSGLLRFVHSRGAHGPFTPEGLAQVLEAAGFLEVKVRPVGRWLEGSAVRA